MKQSVKTIFFVAVALGATLSPLPVQATCQNISGLLIPMGMARRTIRATGPTDISYAKIFTNGGGFSTGSELNVGLNKTIGFLPSTGSFNITIASLLNDAAGGSGSDNNCFNTGIKFILSAMNGEICGSVANGPWTVMYQVNTCGLPDGVFRGLVEHGHYGLGFSPSYKVEIQVASFETSGTVLKASDTGCFKVATAGGASGCAETVN